MSQPTIIPTSLTLRFFHLPFEVGNSWVGKISPIKIKVLCQKKKSLQNVCITSITAVGLEKNSSKLYITEPPSTPLCEVIGQPINLMLLSVAANRLRFLRSILLCADTLRADSLVLDWGRFRRRIPYRARKIHFSLHVVWQLIYQLRRRRRRQLQWSKQQLCTCITLFSTFLSRPRTTTATTWNLLIWRFMEDVDIWRRIFLPLCELE